MLKRIVILILLSLVANHSFSQIDDFLKKIPGVGDVMDEAVSTSIKDAYPSALWLNNLDKQMNTQSDAQFSTALNPGYYRFRFNTFCLHAGAYAPTEGAGYLVAPLKGSKANLIKSILTKYSEHSEIDQKDVQILIWGIEANEKFTDYPPDFQVRVTPLLTPEDIASMQVDVKQIAYDLLPQDAKNVVDFYNDLRAKISNVNASYEDIEQLAVKTGIAPIGKGSKNIIAGTWTSIGGGAYVRCFPEGYKKSNVEVYIPSDVNIQKDNNGNILSLDDGTSRIEFSYENGSGKFKSAVLTNLSTNEQTTIENNLSDDAGINSGTDGFISLVKKSFGKKKSGRLEGDALKELKSLKSIELSLNTLIDKNGSGGNGYSLSVNSVNKFVSEIESGPKKGGDKGRIKGLENINGLVFAPANTSNQRLGNGGPEGGNGNKNPPPPPKKQNCNPDITIHRLSPDYLPEPGKSFTVTLDIVADVDCKIEGVRFTLFGVSREIGRCINEYDPDWYDTRLDFYIDPVSNSSLNVSGDSLSAESSSEVNTITIGCSDYGAFGKLKAEVNVNGDWIPAKDDKNSSSFYINLPYDADNNGIADTWEITNGVLSLPATWDEDPFPSGQATTGDGLTNYEEYRGVYESDGSTGIEHVRTDPKKKDIFIIDDDQIFPMATWNAASDIKSHWLTGQLVYGTKAGSDLTMYRWVNFCSGYAKGNKYAVRLIKVNGLDDPYGNWPDLGVMGYNEGDGPPRKSDRTVIFPDRVKYWLARMSDTLTVWLKIYPLGFVYDGITYTPKQIKNLISALNNPGKLDLIAGFWGDLNVVHEVGHACNLDHHGGGDTTKLASGDPKCPMKYRGDFDITKAMRKFAASLFYIMDKEGIIPILIYTGWRFCKTKDNCWKHLTVNDSK